MNVSFFDIRKAMHIVKFFNMYLYFCEPLAILMHM